MGTEFLVIATMMVIPTILVAMWDIRNEWLPWMIGIMLVSFMMAAIL